jgi:hypothetical protein
MIKHLASEESGWRGRKRAESVREKSAGRRETMVIGGKHRAVSPQVTSMTRRDSAGQEGALKTFAT